MTSPRTVLIDSINLSVDGGELIAIVGEVGSGKSSLLAAVMGEMIKIEGDVNVSVCSGACVHGAHINTHVTKKIIDFKL